MARRPSSCTQWRVSPSGAVSFLLSRGRVCTEGAGPMLPVRPRGKADLTAAPEEAPGARLDRRVPPRFHPLAIEWLSSAPAPSFFQQGDPGLHLVRPRP